MRQNKKNITQNKKGGDLDDFDVDETLEDMDEGVLGDIDYSSPSQQNSRMSLGGSKKSKKGGGMYKDLDELMEENEVEHFGDEDYENEEEYEEEDEDMEGGSKNKNKRKSQVKRSSQVKRKLQVKRKSQVKRSSQVKRKSQNKKRVSPSKKTSPKRKYKQ